MSHHLWEPTSPTLQAYRFLEPRFDERRPNVACGVGWAGIVRSLDAAMGEIDPRYRLDQVKEKFGSLRYYFRPSESAQPYDLQRMNDLVREAERQADRTCERCGGVADGVERPWLKKLCAECAAA